MQPLIEFRDAQLGYGCRDIILSDVNLRIGRGEFWGIVGPNGSGKTTFLRTLLGLLKPVGGAVTLSGEDGELRFGYVPQRETVDTLFPIPVHDIVLMGRYGRVGAVRRPRRADHDIARRCLAQVGIEHLARRDYPELSGGQRQRVLIARALATEPDVLVLDEPTHGMDLPSEHGLLELVRTLHKENQLTVVLVSHLLGSVAESSQWIAIIASGRLEVGSRDEMLTEERLGRLYGMPVRVHNMDGRCAVLVGNAIV
ncbi:MAG TPA: metal ABC transporter ATP-binding protein [Armatimonadota bacterium]|nr:metal ABC transporter ATP-binding protein [Armatimonadota bacterium]